MSAVSNNMEDAIRYHKAGKLDKAEKVCRRVLKKVPEHSGALHLLGVIALQHGHYVVAEEFIAKAIYSNPDNPIFYFNLGNVYQAQDKLDEAILSYREAIQRNPAFADACNNLGVCLKIVGKLEESVGAFAQALAVRPDFVNARFNQGNIFQEQGRLDEAIASYQWVVKLKPDYANAWLNLGNAYKSMGELGKAIYSYGRAIKLNKDYGEAYFNLGNAYQKSMQHNNAVLAFRNAQRLMPGDAEVCFCLGISCEKKCDYEGAAVAFRQGLKINPKAMHGYMGLGGVLSQAGELEHARQVYKDMYRAGPDDFMALVMEGHVLSSMGDFVAAESVLHQAIRGRPNFGGAYYFLSIIKKFEMDDVDKLAMEKVYQDPDLDEEDKSFICFSLSKACDDCKEYDLSFKYLLEGNMLYRKLYQYDIADDEERFSMIKSVFTEEFFNKRKDYGVRDTAPIFIVGMMRSGTTLVEQILSSHPAVCGAGELNDLKQLVFRVADGYESIVALSKSESVGLAREYLGRLEKYSMEGYVTDKMPNNFFYIGMIRLMFPNAKIIHCVRDPMDTCVSIFKQVFSGSYKYAYNLKELGQYYCLYKGLMNHWHQVLPGYIYDVEYEAMVDNQEDVTRKLLDFCGLPWDEACMSFHESGRVVRTASVAQVRQPIYQGSVQRWRKYEAFLGPLQEVLRQM